MKEISIRPGSVAKIFIIVSLIMVIGHIGGRISDHFFGRTFGFYFFDLNREDSIPTFVASMGLGMCSIVLFVIAHLEKRNGSPGVAHWMGLACLFLYMAIDETVRIHEKMGGPLRELYDPDVLYDMVWLVPYGALAILVGVFYMKFIKRLPRETRSLFILSGLIYLLGAVGFEYLGGRQDALHGVADFKYQMFVVLEEGFELLGTGIFLYAVLNHLSVRYGGLRFVVPVKHTNTTLETSETKDPPTVSESN